MSDINANIGVNFDTAQALAELKNLQRQLSQFHTSISRTSESAAIAQKNLQTNLLNSVNATGNFIAQMGVIKTSTESFTHALENNKLSMREYFRYAGGASKTFGRLFTNEFNTIGRVAEERVKRLQTQYIKMGRDTTGAMKAMSIMPATLDINSMSTQMQISAQKQAIFNQLLKQGSTQLLNFGKNTQWAGRQLMVGFTIPLIAMGSSATKAFQDIELAAIKFKRVYGDLGTSQQETDAMLAQIRSIGDAYTKYGVAVKDTIALAADAAAAGFANQDLIAQTTQATKLSVLGQIDQQQALETTISLQSAFGISAAELATTIDFLNSVENQTVVSLDDITTAIPKVAPVIQQLGGDVKDLAFFMTAMKEGGVNASEGANALKSGLASLINPSTKASAMLASVGINIKEIVEKDKGNLKKTVLDVGAALDTLDPLSRARAIEQMFGKFQFARMSTLFDNINKQGSQASRVLDLMGMSASDLASITDKELGIQGASSLTKFRAAIEKLKATLAPVGELFMKIFTPILENISGLLDRFNNLSDGVKKTIGVIVAVVAGLGPIVLMTFGLLMNAFANGIKLFATLRAGYQRLTGGSVELGQQTQYLTMEQLDAAAAAHSLDQSHAKLIQTFNLEAGSVNSLRNAYSNATVAAKNFSLANPGMISRTAVKRFASGGVVRGPGTGTSDSIPAMLSNGETVVPAKQSKKYGGLLSGIIANNIPGFAGGRIGFDGQSYDIPTSTGQKALDEIIGKFSKDTEGLTFALEALQDNANELGMSFKVNADTLSKFLDEVGVQRNNPKGSSATPYKGQKYVAAHAMGNLPDITDPKELERLAAATDSATLAKLLRADAAAGKPVKQFSNFVNVLPEEANKKSRGGNFIMGRDEMAGLYSGPQSDRTLAMVYKTIMDKENLAFQDLINDPNLMQGITGSVRNLGKLISEEISLLPEHFGEEEFYAAVDRAVKRVDVADSRLRGAVDDMQKPAMLAPTGAKGKAQERKAIGKKDIGLKSALGVPLYAESYKSEGNENLLKLADKIGREQAHAEALGYDAQYNAEVKARANKNGTTRARTEGTAYNAELEKTTKDPYVVSRDRQSPHPLASQDGRDDAVAYDTAVQKSIARNQRNVAKRSGIIGNFGESNEVKRTTTNLTSLNNKLMGASFGLTTLASMGSMAGGTLGKVSNQLMKYSGILFGLMSVTQLMTKQALLNLTVERAKMASNAMRAVDIAAGGKTTGFLPILSKLLFGFKALLGPIGITTGLITAGVVAYKLIAASQERARMATEGLADAMNMTSGKVKVLDRLLGQTSTARPGSGATISSIQSTTSEQNKIDTIQQDEEFKTTFKKDIQALKSATVKEARIAFQAISLDLGSQGYSKDAIDLYLKALAEEAGKTKVLLEFEKIDLSTKQGRKEASKLANSLAKDFEKEFKNGVKKVAVGGTVGRGGSGLGAVPKEQLSGGQQKVLNESSQFVSAKLVNLTNLFATQKIKAKEYQAAIADVFKGMPEGADKIRIVEAALKNISPEFAKSVIGIKDYETKQKLLRAAVLDTALAQELLNELMSEVPGVAEAARAKLDKLIAVQDSDATRISSLLGLKTIDDTPKQLSPIQQALKDLKEQKADTIAQTKAYKTLIKAGYDAKTAAEMVNNVSLAKLINNPKAAGLSFKQLKKQIDETAKAQEKLNMAQDPFYKTKQNMEKFSKAYDAMMEKFRIQEARVRQKYEPAVDRAKETIDKITDDFAAKLDPINERTSALNHDLSLIDKQAESINKQYDDQAAALEQINKLNQDAIQQGKARISIADALSQGDISAAAQAVQDSRAASAASAAQSQTDMLGRARQQALDNIKINGLTRKQIEQELWTLSQQQYSLELERDKLLKAANIELKTAEETLNAQLKVIENEKLAWDNAQLAIDEAQNGYDTMKISLEEQLALVQAIVAAWAAAAAAAAAKPVSPTPPGLGAGTDMNGGRDDWQNNKKSNTSGSTSDIIAARRDRYGYISKGGMIPQYFADGGGPKGTDTVPAWLTPGEYVINKKATRVFGPLLEAINTNKFPSFEIDRKFGLPTYNTGTGSNMMSPAVMPRNDVPTQSDNSNTVYNYSLSVNMNGSNVNPDDVANAVLIKIRQMENQRVRGQVRY